MTANPLLLAGDLAAGRLAGLRSRLESTQTEAVTGRTADPARAVSGDIGRLQRLEGAVHYAGDRAAAIGFAGERAALAQTALGQIADQTGEVWRTLITEEGREEATDFPVIGALAGAAFDDAVARLNIQFGERPLFGGNDTSQPPLADAGTILDAVRAVAAAAPDAATALTDIEAWFNDPGGFDTVAWQGGTGDAPGTETAPGTRLQSSVRGDDAAVRDTLRALAVAVIAAEEADEGDQRTYATAARDQSAGALGSLGELRAGLGVTEQRLAETKAGYEAQSVTLSIAFNALTSVDQAEAAVRMRDIENQLQAAYTTTARMADLSLVNFLR